MKTIKRERHYDCLKNQTIFTVTMAKKVWSIHCDDFDFHVSSTSGEYATRKEAEKHMLEDIEWARRMGDNKYYGLIQRDKIIIKNFIQNEEKAIKRQMARRPEKDFYEKNLLGVRVSWDGAIIATVKGTFFELDEYAYKELWGGDSFIFRDADGDIQRYKSVPKVMVEGF